MPASAAYMYMFFAPPNGLLNVMAICSVLESPAMVDDTAPTAHCVFLSTVVELSSLEPDEVPLSEIREMVPALRS